MTLESKAEINNNSSLKSVGNEYRTKKNLVESRSEVVIL